MKVDPKNYIGMELLILYRVFVLLKFGIVLLLAFKSFKATMQLLSFMTIMPLRKVFQTLMLTFCDTIQVNL